MRLCPLCVCVCVCVGLQGMITDNLSQCPHTGSIKHTHSLCVYGQMLKPDAFLQTAGA